MNILEMGLKAQELTVKANKLALTDADLRNISAAGLRLVHRGDTKRTQTTCDCASYPFPHRLFSGKCFNHANESQQEVYVDPSYKNMSQDQIAADEAGVSGSYFL